MLTALGAVFVLVGALWAISSAVYNVYLHPLSRYPGPPLAAASRLWFCWHLIRGELPFMIHELHLKYGDVVRVAPDELSYTHPDAWNQIYGLQPGKREIMKDPTFYSSLPSGKGSIVSADRERHGHLRKLMSYGFSERALREQESVVRFYADYFHQRIMETLGGKEGEVDLVRWYNFFTFDVMGHLVFGESFNCLESTGYNPWVALIFDSVRIGGLLRSIKFWPWLTPIVQHLVPAKLQERRKEQKRIARQKAAYRKSIEDGRRDLISSLLQPDNGVTDAEYQSTVESLIIAGSETTATLLAGVTFHLLKNPDKLKRVTMEVRNAFSSPEEITFVHVNKLPYLIACLTEALRIYPPVGDGFPRNTGENTEMILDEPVPPNTLVRVTHWATFHSPSNFACPDDFIPERWLEGEHGFDNDRKSALQPFHVGPRNCIGRNLAYMEMRLLVALVLFRFDMELCPVSEDWDKQKSFLLWAKPKLMVRLSPRAV
ncbi:cytochrome P450 [Aspergillus floccosus]